MSKHRWWLWLLWIMAIGGCVAWWATYRWARAPYQVSREQKLGTETTKVVESPKVERAADTTAPETSDCCGILDERELVRVNYTDKDGNGEIIVYSGPAAAQLTLSKLVDFNKLRAIKLDKGPVNVYLGSIATDVVFGQDKTKVEHAVYEHYFGTVRVKGVVCDIGCVRLPGIFYSPVKEKGQEGMIAVCLGQYPPPKKPKELRAGVLSPKERVINFQ